MSVRMLRTTSRRSAASKLSVTAGPAATAPGGGPGSPPPGSWPLISCPVPLYRRGCSVSVAGGVVDEDSCVDFAFPHGGAPGSGGCDAQPTSQIVAAAQASGAKFCLWCFDILVFPGAPVQVS